MKKRTKIILIVIASVLVVACLAISVPFIVDAFGRLISNGYVAWVAGDELDVSKHGFPELRENDRGNNDVRYGESWYVDINGFEFWYSSTDTEPVILFWQSWAPILPPIYKTYNSYTDDNPEFFWSSNPTEEYEGYVSFREDIDVFGEVLMVEVDGVETFLSMKLEDMLLQDKVYDLVPDSIGDPYSYNEKWDFTMSMDRFEGVYATACVIKLDGEYYITFDRYDKFYKLSEEFRNELLDMRLTK